MTAAAEARVDSGARGDEIRIGIALSAMGFVLAGLGACVAILARDLDEPPGRLALLSSGFAVGLLVVAVIGPRLLRSWSIPTAMGFGSVVCAFGAGLLALAPAYTVVIAGALCVGLGGAMLTLVAPLMLNGPTAAVRLSRVNAVASGAGILAPLTIGAIDGLGPSGRLAMLAAAPPLLLLAVLTRRTNPIAPVTPTDDRRPTFRQVGGRVDEPVAVLIDSAPAVGLGRKWRGRVGRQVVVDVGIGWLRVVLSVSVEFCFVVWAVARLVATGLPTATAASLGSAFPIGMAVGRAIGPLRWRNWSPVLPSGALAACGTLMVSLFDTPVIVAVGLVVAGLGVAPLYPVTLASLVATPGLSSARLSAVGALASGTAILLAPAVLAVLARAVDLRTAYLVTLPLIAVLFLLSRRSGRTSFV
ncbi:MFS transporter [Kribbella jiaozuonensis]|uniref:MFS transporter n=1 Tax=Kribbella jiaozuonensis TaxID=2575441 RepID=A0A4U3LD21_9ACTN|nr:MFS transporter [Kribbella jiaozuonensis]TKK73348.1 MFS transporter [Kribbella jiaozuonensis]